MQRFDSAALWLEGFKSELTKKNYVSHLEKFCKFHRITPDSLATMEAHGAKRLIIEYVIHLKKVARKSAGKPEKGMISVNSIPIYLEGVYSFLDAHEIAVPKKSIVRYYPEGVTNSFRAYKREEISKILSFADPRERCIILLMVSSGIRIGALQSLFFKDLIINDGMGLLVVYSYSKASRYVTFVTPECLKAIEEYKESRIRQEEKITPESPIIRDKVAWMGRKTNKAHPITSSTIRRLLLKCLKQAGIYSDEIQPAHAFRKFFNTAAKNAGVEKDYKELFMGHSIDLDDVYYDINDAESQKKLLSEYLKAVDALTIDNSNRLKRQVKELEQEKSDFAKYRPFLDEMMRKAKL